MITVRIYTPRGEYKTLENVSIVNVDSAQEGRRGILPNHISTAFALDIGRMELVQKSRRLKYTISGGMLYFEKKGNECTILTPAVESIDEIDVERAKRARERAERRLREKSEDVNVVRARFALRKAINRIRAVEESGDE